MNYIEIVSDAIDYIESNLEQDIRLEELASRYFVSPTHFYRIFRAATNQTVKSYVLRRKLSAAAVALRMTDINITDIAFRYGFNSREQFTRSFVKMFHVSPSRYREDNTSVLLQDKIDVVERDFKNRNKDLILNYSCKELERIRLLGQEINFNPWNQCELEQMMCLMVIDLTSKYTVRSSASRLYNVICGNRNHPSTTVRCFFGVAKESYLGNPDELSERIIPATKYAIFTYSEPMGFIFPTVLK